MSRESAKAQNEDAQRATRWSHTHRLVLATLVLILAGSLGSIFWIGLHVGESTPEGLRIENRTAESLEVFSVLPDGTEVLIARVPPHVSVPTLIQCERTRFIAKNSEGTEVAHRGPFPACNRRDWIIGFQAGEASNAS